MQKRLWIPDWLTLLSAVLIVAAFPPWNLDFLIWICLVPWIFALHRCTNIKAALIQGLWLGFFMSVGGFYWVGYVLHEFAGLPWPLAAIGLFLFGWIGQPQFPIFALLLALRPHPPKPLLMLGVLLVTALGYAGLDWLLPKLFVDTLGHAFHASPILRQAADIGGATLLTFVVFFVNDSTARLAISWLETRHPRRALTAAAPMLITSGILVAATVTYGVRRGAEIRALESQPPATVRAGAIQGNIGDIEKLAAERGLKDAAERVLRNYFTLSDRALNEGERPDFLLWPETAYPSTFRTPFNNDEKLRDAQVELYAKSREVPLLFGGYDHQDNKDFNALFILNPLRPVLPDGHLDLQVYQKNILLPFGEFIPGTENIEFIRKAFPQVGYFGRGVGARSMEVPLKNGSAIHVGPIICYEALFPNYILSAARQGSELILNITNDSWFGPWGEPELHLALTVFRSIEARLPQLRGTNTGISALILPSGEIVNRTPIGSPEVMNVRIPVLKPVPTLMKKWGDWFGPFASFAGLLPMILLAVRRAAFVRRFTENR